MKRNIAFCLGLLLLFFGINRVNAATHLVEHNIAGPNQKVATITKSSLYSLYTASGSIKGSNVGIEGQLNSNHTLPTSFVASDTRKINIVLYSGSSTNNTSNPIKQYYGNFSGRTLTSITLTTNINDGQISSLNNAKFFTYILTQSRSGDSSTATTGSLYNYSIYSD